MTEFTASNGVTVSSETQILTGYRRIIFTAAGGVDTFDLSGPYAKALVEALDHERDEELGRWRWPENRNYVVKHDPLGVRIAHILHEPSFATRVVRPSDVSVGIGSKRDKEFFAAARSYFENHPEPQPWHRAKPEEVWLMGSGLHEFVAIVGTDGRFRFADGTDMATTEEFVTGRRIWPEEAS